MNNISQLGTAFIAGLFIGAGSVYAAIGTNSAPALALPSNAEASVAMNKHKGDAFPKSTVTLGQCDKDSAGPGARCMVDWDLQGDGKNIKKATVGFSRGPNGEWVAVHYF